MQISHFINRPDVEHPKCGECDVSMWLARVERDEPDHDKCTFECPVCENMVVEIVKFDSIYVAARQRKPARCQRTNVSGWTSDESM